MIKRILHIFFKPNPTEIDALISKAIQFKRYTHTQIIFQKMIFNVTDMLSVAYQLKEYFVDSRMNFKTKNANPIIIDCGANVGVSVTYFSKLYPLSKIIAFEPDPQVVDMLKKNIEANNIKNVEVHEKAVWINNDGIEFGLEGADGGSIYFESTQKIKIPSVRLKDILSKYTEIDFLKIDIEGAEVAVIDDCEDELKKINYLFVEYHSWINNTQQLNKLLESLTQNNFRYYIHSIGNQSVKPFTEINSYNGMDVQLDIYAINTSYK